MKGKRAGMEAYYWIFRAIRVPPMIAIAMATMHIPAIQVIAVAKTASDRLIPVTTESPRDKVQKYQMVNGFTLYSITAMAGETCFPRMRRSRPKGKRLGTGNNVESKRLRRMRMKFVTSPRRKMNPE